MTSKKIEKALNDQMNAEIYSSYLYLSMSAHLASKSLNGFGSWMRLQADEESLHAMKFFDFILDRGGKPALASIAQPPAEFGTPLETFIAVLAHERKVTGLIHKLVDLASKENDHATVAFLQWFVAEQVEEEKSAGEVVDQLTLVGDQAAGVLLLDQQLGQRAPAAAAAPPA